MVRISCTWQNNDSSSSPIVITCNCSKAISWGRGGTRGVAAMKIITVVLVVGGGWEHESPRRPAGKRQCWWELECPYLPHTQQGQSCCSLATRENRWRRHRRGLGEEEGRHREKKKHMGKLTARGRSACQRCLVLPTPNSFAQAVLHHEHVEIWPPNLTSGIGTCLVYFKPNGGPVSVQYTSCLSPQFITGGTKTVATLAQALLSMKSSSATWGHGHVPLPGKVGKGSGLEVITKDKNGWRWRRRHVFQK